MDRKNYGVTQQRCFDLFRMISEAPLSSTFGALQMLGGQVTAQNGPTENMDFKA